MNKLAQRLLENIKKRNVTICVVGLGHVGITTALFLSNVGFNVKGIDINVELVEKLNQGILPFPEKDLSKLLIQNLHKNLEIFSKFENIDSVQIGFVCVETPIYPDLTPNLSSFESAVKSLKMKLETGSLLINESTIPPGTSHLLKEILESKNIFILGENLWLAYCPERIYPGNIFQEYIHLDRAIGGYDEVSNQLASELFSKFIKGQLIITSFQVAEIVKLAENTFRNVNIAFANELALICEKFNVNVRNVIELANYHPRVNIHTPGCGVGGHCIPKDPLLLISKFQNSDYSPNLIKQAIKINTEMPKITVQKVLEIYKYYNLKINENPIAILGITYKGDSEDTRNSPAKHIIAGLLKNGFKIKSYDPFTSENFNSQKMLTIKDAIKDVKCILIVTDHSEFKKMNLNEIRGIMKEDPILFDAKGIFKKDQVTKFNFLYFAIGDFELLK
ncbi:MAG: nucleotide sugar dehydrogenase [Promethearchaeota archaeon]